MQGKENIPAFLLLLAITGVTVGLIALALSCTTLGEVRRLKALSADTDTQICNSSPVSDPEDPVSSGTGTQTTNDRAYQVSVKYDDTSGYLTFLVSDLRQDTIYTRSIPGCFLEKSEWDEWKNGRWVQNYQEALNMIRDYCE